MIDAGTLEKLRAGDDGAWRDFVRDYGPVIFSVAHRLRLEGPDRDDLFQEACLACYRSVHTVQDPRRLSSWVFAVAYHLGVDILRRRSQGATQRVPGDPIDTVSLPAAVAPDALESLEEMEQLALLWDALEHLEPRCQELLRSLYLEDPPMSYAEAASRIGVPIGSVGPTRLRCLERLLKTYKALSKRPPAPSTGRSRAREIPAPGGDPAHLRTKGPRPGRRSSATQGRKGNDLP